VIALDPPPPLHVRLVARIAATLLRIQHGPPPDPRALKRVLVVRTDDRVGNALLTIPLARALSFALPEASVDLLLAGKRAPVAEGLQGFRVVRFDKRAGPLAYLRFLQGIWGQYDAVIDAAHWHAFSLTSFLLGACATRGWLVGARRGPWELYSAAIEGKAEDKVALALGLGLHPATPPLETALGRADAPVKGKFALLNPGSRKADHRWPAEQFALLARGLSQRFGLRSVIFWGPGEESLARQVAEQGGAELAPPTDLDQLASCLRACALAVTNDTGPMHLAAACGAPTVAVFLDAAGLRWAHPGPRFEAVVAPKGSDEVLAAATRLLDTRRNAEEPARSPEEGP
jgi:ADP-heptose:LPS heptosyltransferase